VRVVLLVTDLERGGTPMRIARLARGLRAEGIDATVGCLAPRGPIGAALERDGIATFACDARGAWDLGVFPRLARQLRRIKPDLIHSTLMHANVAARLAGRWLRIPVVTSTATIEVERRWHRTVERLTARLDRGHVVNSATLAEHVIRTFGRRRNRVYIVPAAPAADPARGADRGAARAGLNIAAPTFIVLWVGRLDPVKRLDYLIHAAEILNDVPVRFLLAGDGPDRARIERMLRLSSAIGRVELLGWRDDLEALYAAADAFAFPTRTEGTPNAVLDAMVYGLPVVASDIPVLRELCGDDQRLCLVRTDSPAAFADALMRLYRDEPARRALGARAAKWASRLSPQATARATIEVYHRILGRT
jgi:glycosyltransferase involved in cell wall biosynthesis